MKLISSVAQSPVHSLIIMVLKFLHCHDKILHCTVFYRDHNLLNFNGRVLRFTSDNQTPELRWESCLALVATWWLYSGLFFSLKK